MHCDSWTQLEKHVTHKTGSSDQTLRPLLEPDFFSSSGKPTFFLCRNKTQELKRLLDRQKRKSNLPLKSSSQRWSQNHFPIFFFVLLWTKMISSQSQVGHFLAPEILLEKEKSCSQLRFSHALYFCADPLHLSCSRRWRVPLPAPTSTTSTSLIQIFPANYDRWIYKEGRNENKLMAQYQLFKVFHILGRTGN